MAKSLTQLQAQIAKLQKQAQSLQAKEAGVVIERIRTAVEHYGLTPEDLFGSRRKAAKTAQKPGKKAAAKPAAGKRSAAKPSPSKGKRVPIKYRDKQGNTWTGRGSQPRWLAAAIKSGQSLKDFAIG